MEETGSQKSEPLLACPKDSRQMTDHGKSHFRGTSLDDAECLWPKELIAPRNSQTSSSKAGRNIPRRHTLGGPRSSKEILGMQASDMDKKREAFLEHLKQKYPHHATAIMGHQERLRDQEFPGKFKGIPFAIKHPEKTVLVTHELAHKALQCMLVSLHSELDIQRYLMKIESSQRTRSPKLSQSPQLNLGEQAEYLSEVSADSLEIMSEGEPLSPFSRGSRTRASLPVVRTTNQTKERSLGVLYLQYGDETKQLRMPNEITGIDTIRALFVSAFPQQLTMKMLDSPSVAIYIKDDSRNIYYELSDIRNIQDRSFLKVYNKDPAHAFNHKPRAVNGDVRMQREIFPNASRPGSASHPPHALPTSPPAAPMPHSMPPSPSRIPYGTVRPVSGPGNATIPRDRLSSTPASRSISPSPSAILERRDVKPDEDMGNKSLTLYRNEGLYADPYLYHEGRMSIASSHTGHPLDVPDHVVAYHRSTMRSSSTYCNPPLPPEIMEQSLYRHKSRKYPDSHLPTLSTKTPPTSPHRVVDVRMVDIHTHHNTPMSPHTLHLERSSPGRQSVKKDPGTPVFVEGKPRSLSGMVEIVPSVPEKKAFGYGSAVIPKENETRERMQAMEKQIASLTGLVQSAFLKGSNTSNSKDASSEKMMKATPSKNSIEKTGSPRVLSGKNSLGASEVANSSPSHSLLTGSTSMQVNLFDMKRNVSDLRFQLHQMRQLQLQNQETLKAMVKKAELEINGKVIERAKRLEDPVHRQRHLVEQERQKYLLEEERIVKSLCDLESFVEDLKKESRVTNQIVTLKDVEDGACLLRQVGEAVATLKGEFPTLQNKMRAILRIEVEAVRFLKEEPHKLDILLKRVRSMTDTLSTLRKHVTDGLLKGVDPSQAAQYNAMEKATAAEVLKNQEDVRNSHSSPQQTSAAEPPAGSRNMSEVIPVSTVTVHQVQSSPVVFHQSQHSSKLVSQPPSSPPISSPPASSSGPSHPAPSVTESATVTTTTSQQTQAPHSPQASVNGASVQSLFIEELHSASARNRALSLEKAEKKWEEKRQNLDHYNGKEFEKLLEEAQANIMKSIPNLEMPPQVVASPKAEPTEKLGVSGEALNTEQETERPVKSPPPPPPPRRSYLVGSGLSTRLGEVSYVTRKENPLAKESNEDTNQGSPLKVPKDDQASPQSLHTVPSAVDDDEEEDGDRIMAELQAFQKCSYMDINSNSHAEHSRNNTHTKDARPVALTQPKEKKVYGEATKDSDDHKDETKGRMEDMVSDASATNENSAFSKHLFMENKDYAPLNSLKSHSDLSRVIENETKNMPEEAPCPATDTGRQMPKYGVIREYGYSTSQSELNESDKPALVKQVGSDTEEIPLASTSPHEQEMPANGQSQVVLLKQKVSKNMVLNDIDEAESPTSSPGEEDLQSENVAFMITKTAVQFLSSGEVHDIVNRKGEDVQTVNIDSKKEPMTQQGESDSPESEEPVVCLDKKPVIIIFDEPMDIRSAYKRLSTIFEECDEELEKMMREEKIDEEDEGEESDRPDAHDAEMTQTDMAEYTSKHRSEDQLGPRSSRDSATDIAPFEGQEVDNVDPGKLRYLDGPDPESKLDAPEAKKKFKFKFPKKQLAALTQAIRTGTKTGKKTLQVVVYEEEEEDGTLKQHKEAKRFEIPSSHPEDLSVKQEPNVAVWPSRTDEIRKNTYRTLDSLEQTIKQLENTISEMCPKSVTGITSRLEGASASGSVFSPQEPIVLEESNVDVESPSTIPSASHKASASPSQTSRMPIPAATKSRQPGSVDKTSKQHKLQDQRQYRQANGNAKRAGGDYKATSPTQAASKIPAFPSTSGKSSSMPSGDNTNLPAPPNKASVPSSNHLSLPAGRPTHSVSFIPSVSNGSLKFQTPPHAGKGHHHHHPSFSTQAQNGRPTPLPPSPLSSSSFSSSSPTSPTSLNQGMKSVRSIHTPSFTSYKSQNGGVGKSTPSSTTTKEPS